MTDKEILTMVGQYGYWINGEVLEMNDIGVLEFARAIQKAESEACAVAIEDLIPLLDPERKPTIFMCAYTCLNKYEPKEVDA